MFKKKGKSYRLENNNKKRNHIWLDTQTTDCKSIHVDFRSVSFFFSRHHFILKLTNTIRRIFLAFFHSKKKSVENDAIFCKGDPTHLHIYRVQKERDQKRLLYREAAQFVDFSLQKWPHLKSGRKRKKNKQKNFFFFKWIFSCLSLHPHNTKEFSCDVPPIVSRHFYFLLFPNQNSDGYYTL